MLLYGSVKNQSIRWIDLGFFSIQPSEFAKIILMVWVACFYDKHKDDLDKYMKVFYPLVVSAVIAFLRKPIKPSVFFIISSIYAEDFYPKMRHCRCSAA